MSVFQQVDTLKIFVGAFSFYKFTPYCFENTQFYGKMVSFLKLTVTKERKPSKTKKNL